MITLPATVLGPEQAIRELLQGAATVHCLIPDWFPHASQRRIPDIYIRRAAARHGRKVRVRWQWCRETADGDTETVFLVALADGSSHGTKYVTNVAPGFPLNPRPGATLPKGSPPQ